MSVLLLFDCCGGFRNQTFPTLIFVDNDQIFNLFWGQNTLKYFSKIFEYSFRTFQNLQTYSDICSLDLLSYKYIRIFVRPKIISLSITLISLVFRSPCLYHNKFQTKENVTLDSLPRAYLQLHKKRLNLML